MSFSQREKVPAARADEGIAPLLLEIRPPHQSASADSFSLREKREPHFESAGRVTSFSLGEKQAFLF